MTKTAARSGRSLGSQGTWRADALGARAAAALLVLMLGSCTGPGLEPPDDNHNLSGGPTIQPPTMPGRTADAAVPQPGSDRGNESPPGAVQPGSSPGPADAGTGFGNPTQNDPDEAQDEDAGF